MTDDILTYHCVPPDWIRGGVIITPPPGGPGDLPGWHLTWVDDFATINTGRWAVRNGQQQGGHLEAMKPANVTIDTAVAGATDGHALRLQAKQEVYMGFNYTSGQIDTRGVYQLPNYFRIECRARTAWQMGIWPAPLWFRDYNGAGAYEIDLVENMGVDVSKDMKYTLHGGADYGSNHKQAGPVHDTIPDRSGWHTYTIEKAPGSIKVWRDDILKGFWNRTGTGSSPFGSFTTAAWDTAFETPTRPWAIWSNLQIGSAGGTPDGTTDWSPDASAVWVDYIYMWVPA